MFLGRIKSGNWPEMGEKQHSAYLSPKWKSKYKSKVTIEIQE